ncbi:hypothetical protein Y919_03580 [Caloranaerobacter azorensis H53214]|uniref:ABC transmembrane type-1 domain-containing protein n=1 Tax=Caloranaerobacter azorensis H53214 TaxID=1156417 RepID=A0A096BI91_9FIRM|nr:iron ABC transporter permease [Caloranaerobacter azorensis]KGG80920.1 hypothetical protein Y919_03580 [Caloranaerobacter azorensis H53214]
MKKNLQNITKSCSKDKKDILLNIFAKTRLCFDFQNIILLLLFIFVGFIILYPILMIFINSLQAEGDFNISGYINVFKSSSNIKSLINSFKLSFGVLLGTWFIGGMLAFLRNRTDFRFKNLIDFFIFLSFVVPPYVIAIAWIELTSRGGYINRILLKMFPNINYTFQTYSLKAAILILIIHLYPLVYFGVSNALIKINRDLENSAKISGATNFKVLFTIVIPLLFPAFISTGLLVISRSMANFEVVAQLALPVGESVLTTQIFSAISQLRLNLASILSLVLVGISYLFFLVSENKLSKKRYYFEDYNSNINENYIKLGKFDFIINFIVVVFFIITFIIPMCTIFISSLLKRWGIPVSLKNITIDNYKILFLENEMMRNSILNSIFYGLVSATIAIIIGSLAVYLYKNNRDIKFKFLFNICQLPIAFPNIILAIGAIFAWINEPIKLYGTKWIIIITYIVLFIPIVIKQIKGISDNISDSMDKSAMIMGIPLINRYKDIFIPHIKDGLISGWLICFMIALKEVSISLLLYAKGTETIGVMLFTVQSNSYGLEMTSCISVVVIVISIIGNFIVRKIGVRSFNDGRINY